MKIFTHNITKVATLMLVFLCFSWSQIFAQGLDTELLTAANKVSVGEVVVVNLYVEPVDSQPVYTVSTNLVYDPTKLEFISAEMSYEWVELVQKELSKTDTVNGLITRAAGYPNGFLGSAKFVSYKFRAIRTGDTRVFIAMGNAYNEVNQDVGIKNTDLLLNINGTEPLQDKSFDLALKIKSNTAFYKQEDYTFSIYHKKEDKSQQAVTKIWVFDEDWNVHFEDERLWRTDQDTVLNFIIPGGTIVEEGNYKIIAKVRFEDDREYEVAEKDVGVLSNGQTWFTKNSGMFMQLFIIVVLVAILHHIFSEREVYFRLRTFLRKANKKSNSKSKKDHTA